MERKCLVRGERRPSEKQSKKDPQSTRRSEFDNRRR
jgi:hypothetical protein